MCYFYSRKSPFSSNSSHCGGDFTTKLHDQLSYRPKDIKRDIQREMGVQINYKKAWRAKEHGISEINGSFEDAYKKLPKYCEDLKKSNPFTTAIVDATSDGRFRRMFLSFGASAQGFRFCSPILSLDGTSKASIKEFYFLQPRLMHWAPYS